MKDFYSFAPHSLLISDLTLKSTDKYCPDLLFCPPLSVCLFAFLPVKSDFATLHMYYE